MFAAIHDRTRNANDDPATTGQAGFRVASVSAALHAAQHNNDADDAAGVKGRHWCAHILRRERKEVGCGIEGRDYYACLPMSALNSPGDPLQPDPYG
jgi:hypothetical protein